MYFKNPEIREVAISHFRLLFQKGADIHVPDNNGRTPLSWAAGSVYCFQHNLRFLIEQGADIQSPDKDGRTPLSWASECGHGDTVRLLLENSAEIQSQDVTGRTPLSWAAQSNSQESNLGILLEKGLDVDLPDKDGKTPLLWATMSIGNHGADVARKLCASYWRKGLRLVEEIAQGEHRYPGPQNVETDKLSNFYWTRAWMLTCGITRKGHS
jgi:hypothetical protein